MADARLPAESFLADPAFDLAVSTCTARLCDHLGQHVGGTAMSPELYPELVAVLCDMVRHRHIEAAQLEGRDPIETWAEFVADSRHWRQAQRV